MAEESAQTINITMYGREGWSYAMRGHYMAAEAMFMMAEVGAKVIDEDVIFNPRLCVARFAPIDMRYAGDKRIVPIHPDENAVAKIYLSGEQNPVTHASFLKEPEINFSKLVENIRHYICMFEPGYHALNSKRDKEHVMVLSTGRVGTVSLLHLLKDTNLIPHHSYTFETAMTDKAHMMCQLVEGEFPKRPETNWLRTRAAEWISAELQDKRMIGMSHLDTIMAPAFAAMHPKSKFVYIRRDPLDIYKSMYYKNQFGDQQADPILYSTEPEWQWKRPIRSLAQRIAFHIQFTDTFCLALGAALGGRLMVVDAESLFSGGEWAIKDLLRFIGSDVPYLTAVDHYKTKVNEKSHRLAEMPNMDAEFCETLDKLRRTGTF